MSFAGTYREELAFLREMGRELAVRHPGLCDSLAAPGLDPDVERLLEGFALLAARTRERADDAIPEAIEAIAEVVAPYAVRPMPGSTVIEMTPRAALVRDRIVVPAGAAFGARPVDGVRCELRSTMEAEISPLVLERTVLDGALRGAPRCTLSFRSPLSALDGFHGARPLRLYVHAPLASGSALALAIDRHLESVTFVSAAGEVALGRSATLVDLDRPHLPWPDAAPEGPRHLLEAAYFPERSLFFDIAGLQRVPPSLRTERFDLVLRFESHAPLPERLSEDALRLHCMPAINVFSCNAEPIRWDDDARDVALRAAGQAPDAIEVFDVLGVVGLPEATRRRAHYRPFAGFTHLADEGADGFFALRRARSPLDGGVDTHLRVGRGARRGAETLSIEMRCTNRGLAARLRPGDVCEPIAGSPATASFTNLTPVGPHTSAPIGSDLLHTIVGLASAGHRSRLSPASLRAWLAPFAVPSSSDVARSRACTALATSIRAVRSEPFRAARRGLVERGVALAIELDEARVPSVGEAFLFTRALDRALASELPIHARQQTTVTLAPSGKVIALPARGGVERAP